jgi:hypothetical protein
VCAQIIIKSLVFLFSPPPFFGREVGFNWCTMSLGADNIVLLCAAWDVCMSGAYFESEKLV